ETDLSLQAKLLAIENSQPTTTTHESNWRAATGDYLRRVVDIAVVFDGSVNSPPEPGERFLTVAHGCFVGSKAVLTCVEAIELANGVAQHKRGTVVIIAGIGWYEFELEPIDKLSGLVICNIKRRDDERWAQTKKELLQAGLPE